MSPPSAAHMRAFMAASDGELSDAQSPTLDREEEPQICPSDPQPSSRTPYQLQVNLGDLVDNELWQHIEDLHWEVTLWELNTPPRDPPPAPWGNLVGHRVLNEDDQEVNFPRGEGGNPEDNLFDPLPQLNQMKMWDVL